MEGRPVPVHELGIESKATRHEQNHYRNEVYTLYSV